MEGALTPGTVFATDFRIVRPLSAGGMGVLYVAEQISTSRERALKIMLPNLASSEDLRRRFTQEARVGAQIESEHVVEVVGAGIDPASGAPWLAMELLQGEDFASYLDRTGPLPNAAVLEVFEQLNHALGSAHEKQIVHRDLKPENLFLARSRRAQTSFMVKVLDFGIAKLIDKARTSATGAMGTPLWMAPEQMTPGSSIAPATDVWALGLIAFRALTGKCYWKSAAEENPSSMVVIREVAMDPIVPASKRAYELGCPILPVGFDAWFARCVNRDVSARFPNATAAQNGLRPVLSGGGVNATQPAAPLPMANVSRTTPDPSNISVPPVTHHHDSAPNQAWQQPTGWQQQQAQGWQQPQQSWQQQAPQQVAAKTVMGPMVGMPVMPPRISAPPPPPATGGRRKKSSAPLFLGLGAVVATVAVVLFFATRTPDKKPTKDDDDDKPVATKTRPAVTSNAPNPPPTTPPPPPRTAPPPNPTRPPPTEPGPVVVVEISPKETNLKEALQREVRAAKAEGKEVMVWTTRPGCAPCQGVITSLPDPRMKRALEKTRLVTINLNALVGPLSGLGYETKVLPCFFLLQDDGTPRDGISGGEWGADTAENIAPVLASFARGTLKPRKSPIRKYSGTP